MSVDNPKQPANRYHFICTNQSCLADVYRFARPLVIQCMLCRHKWSPHNFNENSWAYGRLEANPQAGKELFLSTPCIKHEMVNCEECEKEKLYAE